MYYLIKQIHFGVTAIYVNIRNLSHPIISGISIRYANISFIIKRSKQTITSGKRFEINGTGICNKISSYIISRLTY